MIRGRRTFAPVEFAFLVHDAREMMLAAHLGAAADLVAYRIVDGTGEPTAQESSA